MKDEIRVHVLDCGAMGTDIEQLIGAPEYRGSRHNHNPAATWASCSAHCVLIEHPDGLLLWDTAPPRDWETRWAGTGLDEVIPYDQVEPGHYLDEQLHGLGYEIGDVDQVVLSHLHMDHAGNVKLFNDGHTKIVCHADEVTGASAFEGYFSGGHIKSDYEGLPIETVKGDTEIVEGVTLLEAPGHTWGTMALEVDLPNDGTMIFTSDAIYLQRTLSQRHWGTVVWDNRQWLASLDRLVARRDRKNATLIFGHDSEQLHSLRLAPEAFYH